jgi:hypothetical protein
MKNNMKNFIGIPSLVLSLTLMVGCASDFVSSGSGSSSATSDSTSDSANQTIQMVNQQMAIDAANAAAQQQFNDTMAAQQLNENQHNDEFNQNGLH